MMVGMRDYRIHGEQGDSGVGGVFSLGESLKTPEGSGKRSETPFITGYEDPEGGAEKEYRVRGPTRSEIMNRALKELGKSAFKIHSLLWQWRGAPARGSLPFFTIHSLGRFCSLSRPTVRKALNELVRKGWIIRRGYNKHHKNALYALVAIRKVPRP